MDRIRKSWIYKKLISIKTAIFLLCVLSFFYSIGTIFSQNSEYAEEGGFALWIVRTFHLLDIYTHHASPFLYIAILFWISLFLCTMDRWMVLRKNRRKIGFTLFSLKTFKGSPGYREVRMQGNNDPGPVLKNLGFSIRKQKEDMLEAEMGFSATWLSWIYHAALVFCILGFFTTYLFSFESEVTIWPGEPQTIATVSDQTRWRRFINHLIGNKAAWKAPEEKTFRIGLAEFITEYTYEYKLDFTEENRWWKMDRIRAVFAERDKPLRFKIDNPSYYPKDWKSRLQIYDGDRLKMEKVIEVNDPLRYQGLALYQAAYDQRLHIRIPSTGEMLTVDAGKEFSIPGVKEKIRLEGAVKTGSLFTMDGRVQKIVPFVPVSLIPEPEDGAKQKEDQGKVKETAQPLEKLVLHEPLTVKGQTLIFEGLDEATTLSIRHDPGLPLLWVSSFLFMGVLTLRTWGRWYRIRMVREADTVFFVIQGQGILAREERLARETEEAFQRTG